jgi:hypothetical protein
MNKVEDEDVQSQRPDLAKSMDSIEHDCGFHDIVYTFQFGRKSEF